MIGNNWEPISAVTAQGKVSYTPQLAEPSCGFGPLEVHPNKVPVERDGSLGLEFNGEYLVVWGPSVRERFVSANAEEGSSPLEYAEIAAALNNGDKPTRVVDACGAEYTSRFTASMLRKRAAERGIQLTTMGDLEQALTASAT